MDTDSRVIKFKLGKKNNFYFRYLNENLKKLIRRKITQSAVNFGHFSKILYIFHEKARAVVNVDNDDDINLNPFFIEVHVNHDAT